MVVSEDGLDEDVEEEYDELKGMSLTISVALAQSSTKVAEFTAAVHKICVRREREVNYERRISIGPLITTPVYPIQDRAFHLFL